MLIHQLIQPSQVLNGRLADEIGMASLKVVKHFGYDFAFRLTVSDEAGFEVERIGSELVHGGQPFLKQDG